MKWEQAGCREYWAPRDLQESSGTVSGAKGLLVAAGQAGRVINHTAK